MPRIQRTNLCLLIFAREEIVSRGRLDLFSCFLSTGLQEGLWKVFKFGWSCRINADIEFRTDARGACVRGTRSQKREFVNSGISKKFDHSFRPAHKESQLIGSR